MPGSPENLFSISSGKSVWTVATRRFMRSSAIIPAMELVN